MAQGSIYPRSLKNGAVVFDVRYRTSNGVPRQKRGFPKRRDAERFLNAQLAAVDRGEVVATTATFAPYFDTWLAEHRPRIEEGTYSEYEVHGRLRLKPFFGAMKLTEISAKDVRRYVARLSAEGRLTPKSINNSIVTLRIALAHAEEDGLIPRNPAASRPGSRERIKLPNAHREMDFLRLGEIPRYLEACDEIYRPLAELLIATGLRISEALALTWRDVDWQAHTLRVMRSQKRTGDGSTKGDRARAVEFGPRLAGLLRDLQARYAERSLGDLARRAVFVGPRGGRLNRSDISRGNHKAALRDAGLRESLRLHDLRHRLRRPGSRRVSR